METLSFDYYITKFKGVTIPDNDTFERLLIEASALVNSLVLAPEWLENDSVKAKYNNAICAVADCIYAQNATQSSVISSESVGNHSISYVTKSAQDLMQERKRKALTYLVGTGLLTKAVW